MDNLIPFEKGHKKVGGKKKGYKSIKTILKELNKTKLPAENLKGQLKKLTPQQIIAIKMIQDAMRGNDKARTEYYNRLEGKATEKVEMNTNAKITLVIDSDDETVK